MTCRLYFWCENCSMFLISNCLICGTVVMGVKHLVLTRIGVIGSQLGWVGKYDFASWSCIWPRHANSCLQTYSSLPEFNRLMPAAGRDLPVVSVSATWRQVTTTESCQKREPSRCKGQVTWLANQGSEQALVQANSGGAENRARRNLDGEKKMTATTY